MSEKTKVITGSIALTAGSYISAATAFLVSVLLARFLDKELFGVYIFAISIASICYVFTDFGIDGVTNYFVQRYKDRKPEISSYAVFFGLRIKLILFALVLIFLIFAGLHDYKYLYASIFFAFFTPNQYFRRFLDSFQHFRLSGTLYALESIMRLTFLFFVLNFTSNLSIVVLASSIPMLICSVFALKDILSSVTLKSIGFDEIKNEALFYWKWMAAISFMPPISSNLIQVILGVLNKFGMLAIFAVGFSLSNLIRIASTTFKTAMSPSFIKKTDEREVSYALTDSIRYLLLFTVFSLALIHFISEPLVIIFYTERYADSAIIFEILAFGIAFATIFAGLRPAATSIREPKLVAFSDFISLALIAALAYALIPSFNAVGAALALSFGLIAGNSYLAFVLHLKLKYRFPWKSLLRALIASLISLLPLQFIKVGMLGSLILNACLGIILYILLLYALKEIKEEDIRLLKESLSIVINYVRRLIGGLDKHA